MRIRQMNVSVVTDAVSEWGNEYAAGILGHVRRRCMKIWLCPRRSETILEIFEAQRFWKEERTVGILRAIFASSTIK